MDGLEYYREPEEKTVEPLRPANNMFGNVETIYLSIAAMEA